MVYYSALHWAKKAEKSAQECENIKSTMINVYEFKGSVATFSDLPTNAGIGNVYNVSDTGMNYGWTGTEWDALGEKLDIDEALNKRIKVVNSLPSSPETNVYYYVTE